MAKHMIDISKESMHDELAQFILDNSDWYDLYDSFGDYGDYSNPHDAVEAAIYDMPEEDLVDIINRSLEENYWEDEEAVQAAKDVINKYLGSREGSEEFDNMMGYPMEDINNLTESRNSARISFGYAMSKHMDLLEMCQDEHDLISFVKQICEPEIDNLDQKMYYEEMMTNLMRKSYFAGLEYLTNIILKGEGLGTIPPKGSKRYGENLNWKDIEVSPTDYDCYIENLKEMQNSKIKSQKNWSLRNDSAYFKTQAASTVYGRHLKNK